MNTTLQSPPEQSTIPVPPPFHAKKAGHWYQYINRYWMPFLSGNELKIVLFFLDRQLGWGSAKPQNVQQVRVSRTLISRGVVEHANGKVHHAGVGLVDSTIDSLLATLEERGLLFVRREKTRNGTVCWYSLNPAWVPTDREPASEKFAPRKSGESPRITARTHPENRDQRESKEERVKKKESQSAQSAGLGLSEKKKQAESEKKSADLLQLNNPSIADIERIWIAAWKENFFGAPMPSWRNSRERYALRQYCIRWSRANSIPFGEYFYWCVRNWKGVMERYFDWMQAAPALPSVFFLIRMCDTFEDCFAYRKELEEFWNLPTRERQIQVRIQKGMTREKATEEVERRYGFANEHRRIQQARQQLANEQEAFTLRKKMAGREQLQAAARRKSRIEEEIKPIHVERVMDYDEIDPATFNVEDFGTYEQTPAT